MLQHEKEKFEKETICSSSIATSRTSLQEENESDFSSVSTNTSTPINEELVIKTLKKNNDEYNKKMELGKIIAKAIKDGEIAQDSLCDNFPCFHLFIILIIIHLQSFKRQFFVDGS